MKMSGECEGLRKGIQPQVEKMGARHGKKSGPGRWGLTVVQEVFELCQVSSGARADDPLWARKEGGFVAQKKAMKHRQT